MDRLVLSILMIFALAFTVIVATDDVNSRKRITALEKRVTALEAK